MIEASVLTLTPDVEPEAQPESITTTEPAPRRGPTRREVLSVLARGLTIFGVAVLAFALYLVGLTRFEHDRSQRSLVDQFDQSIETQAAAVGGRIDEGTPVALLEIPTLGGKHEVVVEGTSSTQLKKGPGHFRASPLPGQSGNVVIACRRLTFGAPCFDLDGLDRGDEITLTTGQGAMKYRVSETRSVEKGDDDVIADAGDNRLTVITSQTLLADSRYVVIADLVGRPVPTPEGRPAEVRSSELGINTEGSNVMALFLWLQLLLIASLVAVWCFHRQRTWPVYLVTVPVLALLVLLVFDSLTALLPSTL